MSPLWLIPTSAIKNSRVQVGGINFTKEVDSSSPKLLEAVCNGTVFPEVTIHLMRNTGGEGEKPYYEYTLQDAFIQSYDSSNSADGGGTFSTENVVLGFKTIKWSYKIVDTTGKEQGSVDTGWDLALSQPL